MTRPFTPYHYFWPSDLELWITYTKCCYLNLVAFRRTLLSSDNSCYKHLQDGERKIPILLESNGQGHKLNFVNTWFNTSVLTWKFERRGRYLYIIGSKGQSHCLPLSTLWFWHVVFWDSLAILGQMMSCVERSYTVMAYKLNQHLAIHVSNWLWLDLHWNRLSDTICIFFTNVNVLYNFLQNFFSIIKTVWKVCCSQLDWLMTVLH